jgi:hypothetical protein
VVRWRWVAACVGGEVAGLALAAATFRALDVALPDPRSAPARVAAWVALVVTGAVEGAVLGDLQWRVLRRRLPGAARGHAGVRRVGVRWVGATAALAATGWALGMLPSTLATGASAGGPSTAPPALLVVLLGGLGGAVVGAALGGGQAWAARGALTGLRGWVAVNAVGWGLAVGWVFAAASVPGEGWPAGAVVATGAVAGLGSGALAGLVTSTWLPRMRPVADQEGRHAVVGAQAGRGTVPGPRGGGRDARAAADGGRPR